MTMIDTAACIDALVTRMLGDPHAVLQSLTTPPFPTSRYSVPMSKCLFQKGVPLPLPILNESERSVLRVEMRRSLDRLTEWETDKNVVPDLNMTEMEQKEDLLCPRVSPEVYTTAREHPSPRGEPNQTLPENPVPLNRLRNDRVPICQISSSPMRSKTYKPFNGDPTAAGSVLAVPHLPVNNETLLPEVSGLSEVDSSLPELEISHDSSDDSLLDPESASSASGLSTGETYNTTNDSVKDASESRDESSSSRDTSSGSLYTTESRDTTRSRDTTEDSVCVSEGSTSELDSSNAEAVYRESGKEAPVSGTRESGIETGVSGRNSISTLITTFNTTRTSERSPPSSQVLRHLEALEAAIELDLTLTASSARTPGGTARRKLDMSSPTGGEEGAPSPREQGASTGRGGEEGSMSPRSRSALSLNLSGRVGSRLLPDPLSTPASPSILPGDPQSPSTPNLSPRKSISFYVEVDSPTRVSPRVSLERRNTISSICPSRKLVSPGRGGSPSQAKKTNPIPGRTRSSSSLVQSARSLPSSPVPQLTSNQLLSNQLHRNQLPSNQLPSNQLPSNQLPINQLPSNQLPSNQLPSNQLPSNQLPSNQLPSNQSTAASQDPIGHSSTSEPRLESTSLNNSESFRRVRHESYSTDNSEVIEARASKITALARGVLTRALLKSYKVQQHVKTVQDTLEIISGFSATPARMDSHDKAFYNRLQDTLVQTKEKIHDIFFNWGRAEQLQLISHSRVARREVRLKELQGKLVKPGTARRNMAKKSHKRSAWI